MLPPSTTNKVRKFTLNTFINILLEILGITIRKDEEIKDIKMRNEINKALFTDDMIVMLKKPNESFKKKKKSL